MLILGIDPGFAIVGFGLVEAAGGKALRAEYTPSRNGACAA